MSDSQNSGRPVQPPLFDVKNGGHFEPEIGTIGPLRFDSQLPVARYWFREHLIEQQRPENTVKSYAYDLQLFERQVGLKRIDQITKRDVARFLGDANSRSTKKRRLTSISQFFDWLVKDRQVLKEDPSESFYPDRIALKTPKPLHPDEQERFLEAAAEDSPRSALMCWVMLRVGLGRSELLDLERMDVDVHGDGSAEITIFPRTTRLRNKERKLFAPSEFGKLLEAYEAEKDDSDKLFDILPQSVNKMVDRIAARAGIRKKVTPQILRDTFAVELAKDGADEEQLLHILGLADDARNRMSVQRYLKLGGPPVNSSLASS
ncbi:MAG: tyrosine-type recombinase/integrase [Thermomicrobiales bacterium]